MYSSNQPSSESQSRQPTEPNPFSSSNQGLEGGGQYSAGHSYDGESDDYDRNRDTYTSEEGSSADAQGQRGEYSKSQTGARSAKTTTMSCLPESPQNLGTKANAKPTFQQTKHLKEVFTLVVTVLHQPNQSTTATTEDRRGLSKVLMTEVVLNHLPSPTTNLLHNMADRTRD